MRLTQALALVVGLATTPHCLFSQSLGAAVSKQNLDLPYGATTFGGSSSEEATEVISFLGQQYEGDGVFYAIDRSGSMSPQGELAAAKQEVIRNITEFTSRVQFGIVFFDSGLTKFPAGGQPAEATGANKAAAIAWLSSVSGGSGSCCQAALSAALQFSNLSSAKRRVVVYVGDGGGTCQGADEDSYLRQTLAIISAQNYQRAQINCIGVLDVSPLGEQFMKSLSGQNGGTYTRITR